MYSKRPVVCYRQGVGTYTLNVLLSATGRVYCKRPVVCYRHDVDDDDDDDDDILSILSYILLSLSILSYIYHIIIYPTHTFLSYTCNLCYIRTCVNNVLSLISVQNLTRIE